MERQHLKNMQEEQRRLIIRRSHQEFMEKNRSTVKTILDLQKTQVLVSEEVLVACFSEEPQIRLKSLQTLRKHLALSNSQASVQKLLDCNLIPYLLKLLYHSHIDLRIQAANILTNVAASTSQHSQFLVQCGAIPGFLGLLEGGQAPELLESALWGIGNLSGDSLKIRDEIIRQGGISKLVKIIQQHANIQIIKNSSWALSNLCRGVPPLPKFYCALALPALSKVLAWGIEDSELTVDICWALAQMTQDKKQLANLCQVPAMVRVSLQHLLQDNKRIKLPVLRIIGNLARGGSSFARLLVDSGTLQTLLNLLDSKFQDIQREACWCFSLLVNQDTELTNSLLLNRQLMLRFLRILQEGGSQAKVEVLIALKNICSTGGMLPVLTAFSQLRVQQGLFQLILLEGDPCFLVNLLETLYMLLVLDRQAQGNFFCWTNEQNLLRLQAMQMHKSSHVYERAFKLLDDLQLSLAMHKQ